MHSRTYQLGIVCFVCHYVVPTLPTTLQWKKKDGYELLCCCVQKLLKIRRDGRVERGEGGWGLSGVVGEYLNSIFFFLADHLVV